MKTHIQERFLVVGYIGWFNFGLFLTIDVSTKRKLFVDGWFDARASVEYACRHAKFDITLHRLS